MNMQAAAPSQQRLDYLLERGEIVHFPSCPFAVPSGADHDFLLEQRLASRAHKNIGFDPTSGKVSGYAQGETGQAQQLERIFRDFSAAVTAWLGAAFPRYARGWQLDRVSYRPEQEATRRLRLTARNDLLHVDAFPSRPTNGWRILASSPTSIRPSHASGSPPTRSRACSSAMARTQACPMGGRRRCWIGSGRACCAWCDQVGRARSSYDAFMLRFHNYLKANADFQENCLKKRWEFQPGCAWLAITDTASHAVLSGRFALEHSYFLAPATLALPDESPPALLRAACGYEVLPRAA